MSVDSQIRKLKRICALIPCNQNCLHIGFCAEVYERARNEETNGAARSGVERGNSGNDGDSVCPIPDMGN